MHRRRLFFLAATGLLGVPALAQSVPANFAIDTVAAGISTPTAMTFAPDGRIFVTEQGGNLRIVKQGALLASPFASFSVDSSGERGLLGVALDPNFATNGFVYVYHTVAATESTPAFNRLTRMTASGDTMVPGSATTLFDLDPLSSATNHNGGAIHFGPDGKLYLGVGDNANGANAPSLGTVLGKMLRLNADGTIPTDNPFFASTSGNNRAIWATGLRNPFTFAFQPSSGQMYINDVGQFTYEEINVGSAGANYGWPNAEGAGGGPGLTDPLYYYAHGFANDQGFAIAGGAFYNPDSVTFGSAYVGDYFFADYVRGWVRGLDAGTNQSYDFATGLGNVVDLQVGSDGSLYYLERSVGSVGRIRSTLVAAAPEPTTLGLLALGLLCGQRVARRRH